MKRMQLIAAALCLVMIATVGTGIVAAKQQPASQKVKQFDVLLYQGTGTPIGKLSINTNAWTYVLNARGLTPGTEYWLKCVDVPGILATVTPNAGGTLHMQGKLDTVPPQLIATGATYFLGTGTPPPELSPYMNSDAKYCAKNAFEYEVYGTVYLYIPNTDGTVARLAVNNAFVQATYPYDSGSIYFGTATTDPNGNFHITGSKSYVDQDHFEVAFTSHDGLYGGIDNNVQKTSGCPAQ